MKIAPKINKIAQNKLCVINIVECFSLKIPFSLVNYLVGIKILCICGLPLSPLIFTMRVLRYDKTPANRQSDVPKLEDHWIDSEESSTEVLVFSCCCGFALRASRVVGISTGGPWPLEWWCRKLDKSSRVFLVEVSRCVFRYSRCVFCVSWDSQTGEP